jgi:TM2 domain-containing membrane protein YozV
MNIEYDARRYNVYVAYLLWLLFGGIGAHLFYLGRKPEGLFRFASLSFSLAGIIAGLFSSSIPSHDAAVSFLIGCGFMIVTAFFWILDGSRLAGQVRRLNIDLAYEMVYKERRANDYHSTGARYD